MEIFGSHSVTADAEIIALAHDFLTRMGITDVELHINSVGCRECRPVYKKALQDFLRPHLHQLCETCQSRFETNPMRILDCKSEEDQKIVKDAPVMLDYLCDDCRKSFEELKEMLTAMDIPFVVDDKIVRGLDYYTKTAFEFVSTRIGAQGTVCGGGRYDHLIEEVGGPDMPGVGFGLGKERLLMLMEQNGHQFGGTTAPELFIAYIGKEAKLFSMGLLSKLRTSGIRAVVDANDRNLKGQMKYANKIGAAYTVVIGDDEVSSGMLTLKDMETGEQTSVATEDLISHIRN